MTDKKKKRWNILYVLLGLACLFCVAAMGVYLVAGRQQEREAAREHEELLALAGGAGENQGPETEAEGNGLSEQTGLPEETGEVELAELPIDFEALWEINPEVCGWLTIPDTTVDYPILQHEGEDQSYYLKHTIYGEATTAASIYTEWYNSKDFTDPNTIIYGHNMKQGMFHDLRYFGEQEYFNEHQELYIYLPDRILRYQIFTSYEYDNRHLLASFDFKDEEVYAEYLEDILNPRSMYVMLREGVELTTEDRIVTLSTCVANKPNNRRLVQAVLVEETLAAYRGTEGTEYEEATENGN